MLYLHIYISLYIILKFKLKTSKFNIDCVTYNIIQSISLRVIEHSLIEPLIEIIIVWQNG